MSFIGHLLYCKLADSKNKGEGYITLTKQKVMLKNQNGIEASGYPLVIGKKEDAACFEVVTDYSGK